MGECCGQKEKIGTIYRSGIVGLHRGLMVCDRVYYELIGENRSEVLIGMMGKDQKKFMKR